MPEKTEDGLTTLVQKRIGWIYVAEAEQKPVIAQKENDGEKSQVETYFIDIEQERKKLGMLRWQTLLRIGYQDNGSRCLKCLNSLEKVRQLI